MNPYAHEGYAVNPLTAIVNKVTLLVALQMIKPKQYEHELAK